MRQENLTTVKGGITRQRTKGAALKDSLYDLLNGYVTAQKTVRVREGTFLHDTLPAGTIGLVDYDDTFHVFASENVEGLDEDLYTLHILRDPDGSPLEVIHFAEPFLGALYVSAGFESGVIYHYWLQPPTEWAANTVYTLNDLVRPITGNSFVYRATRLGGAYPAWSAGAPRQVGDRIEPTEYNGLYFEVVAVHGDNPRSGTVEPDWDVEVGATVDENVDGTTQPGAATPPAAPPPRFPDNEDRYGTLNGGTRRVDRR